MFTIQIKRGRGWPIQLSSEMQKIGEIMQKAAQAESAPQEGGEDTPKDGNADVKDAEVVDEEEKKDNDSK